ncbi:MFS transporter [Alteromonas oceanisediminis]|uniref:MFS transporter n=1 Tax=Alteromonas oceanisediminis TaxID=2836180 RepID=UPI001BD98E69|nr:MFS transporter [Alteromonas oceanisediminis]MBT0585589.1 MFS transporter [Alteromonas oceanisediminis]
MNIENSTASAPPITRTLKVAYASGSTAEAVILSTVNMFLLLYYNQVRGAPADLVGMAIAAGLVINAFWDPIVGSWSDRTRSRFGRRHPFMFGSMLPIVFSFYAVFNPPDGLSQTVELLWLAGFNILLQQAMSVYHTPHMAFGGELSSSYTERSKVMAYNTFFLWMGDTAIWVLSFGWMFKSSPGYPNGALDPERWPTFSMTIAIAVLVILFMSSWFTKSRIPYLTTPKEETPKFGFLEFFRDIKRALTNRSYVMLLIGYFFMSMMVGIRSGLWLYTATFFWQLTNDQIAFFVIGSLVSYVFGSSMVTRFHKRFDKRKTAAVACVVYCVGPAIPLLLGYYGILSHNTPYLLAILILFSMLQHAPYSILTTTVYSVLADIADESELKHGIRQEGILYSTRTFFARLDQAIGAALAGWVLAFIAFPEKAVPGEVSEPILMGLALAFVLSTIPGLITTFFYGRITVTKQSYEATQSALAEQKAAASA